MDLSFINEDQNRIPLNDLIVKPNHFKNFILDVVVIGFLAGVFIFAMTLIGAIIGLETYVDFFAFIGISVTEKALVTIALMSVAIVSIITLLYDYIILSGSKYKFSEDRLVFTKNLGLVFNKRMMIPYASLQSVNFFEKGLSNQIFGTGTIVLTKKDGTQIKLESIGSIKETALKVQQKIRAYYDSFGSEQILPNQPVY